MIFDRKPTPLVKESRVHCGRYGRIHQQMSLISGACDRWPVSPFLTLPRSQDEVAQIDGVAEEFGTLQSLRNSFNPILATILMSLDAPAIFMRTKALRALGQIVTSDSTILSMVCFVHLLRLGC